MRRILLAVLSAAVVTGSSGTVVPPSLPESSDRVDVPPRSAGHLSATAPTVGGSSASSTSIDSALSQRGRAESGAPGKVLFDANLAVSGLSEYGSVHNANRIKVVNDPGPLGASRKVLRFEVYESDDQLTGNPRAQAETPRMFSEGDEIWVGFSTYFPTGWPDQLPPGKGNFVTFAEVYGAPYAGSSPVKIAMRAGQNKLTFQRNNTNSYDIPWEAGPIQKNTWHDWVIREKLSRDGTIGFVEIYRNSGGGWKVMPLFGKTRLYTQTIDSSNAVGPLYHKISLYYAAGMNLPSPLVMYFADHKIATSFDAAAPMSHGKPPPESPVTLSPDSQDPGAATSCTLGSMRVDVWDSIINHLTLLR